MSITTATNRTFIESEQYSQFILRNMDDGMLPQNFYRDVTDFGSGETLHIKSIGEATLQEVSEDVALTYNPIESGEVQMQITDYPGDAWYITDKMRQDGAQIEALMAARAQEATRAFQEYVETRSLAVLEAAQTDADPNNINGFAHRIASAESDNVATLGHFRSMKLAFDKAEVPYGGRVAFVDPVVADTLYGIFHSTGNVDSNPTMQDILEGGFSRDHEFVMNVAGWNIMTSNRLPKGSFGDGTTTVTDGVANIFLNIMDDQTKALMVAWRQMPRVEGERNKDRQRDEFVMTGRMGFGAQRVDTLGILITSAVNS
ncbi:MAG: hypothetical protein OQK25_07860 [Gammaproteobacteria bacterium]|nr:hypothetical protein [Gammaproteobacteria bacterium]MCW8982492.1 hypothetical protein [Gammaproteobacteria bacterium]